VEALNARVLKEAYKNYGKQPAREQICTTSAQVAGSNQGYHDEAQSLNLSIRIKNERRIDIQRIEKDVYKRINTKIALGSKVDRYDFCVI
jgi:hypothetical protein